MYTANSMNCLTEAIGMGLRGNGTIPAALLRPASGWPSRPVCRSWSCCSKNIRPRDIMTAEAFHNAETIDMALGCSHQHHAPSAGHRP